MKLSCKDGCHELHSGYQMRAQSHAVVYRTNNAIYSDDETRYLIPCYRCGMVFALRESEIWADDTKPTKMEKS